jgi:hypothetical protein
VTELMYAMSVGTFVPVLRSLSGVLAKGAAHARETGADLGALTQARLAPDMFTLAQQIDVGCHQVRVGVPILAGKAMPDFQPCEPTFPGFERHIAETIAIAEATPEAAFAGVAERQLKIPLPDAGITLEMTGLQFLRDWLTPHFYFAAVTAYDILRTNGAPIGKLDFIAHTGYAIHRDA